MIRFIINLFIGLMISVIGLGAYQKAVEKPIELYYDADVTNESLDYSYRPGQHGTHYDFYLKKNGVTEEIGSFKLIFIPGILYLFFITFIGLTRRILIPVKVHLDDKVSTGPVKIFRKKLMKRKVLRTMSYLW